MYRINPSNRWVRDVRAHYAAGPPEPERFPAELALRDLATDRGEASTSLVLARYAALRAWALARDDAEAAFLEHARTTAIAYLAATPDDWPERSVLSRLLESADPHGEGRELLLQAAELAEGVGHVDGALAARTAAWAAAMRALRLASAADLAAGIAALLRRHGAPGPAAEWEAAAARLAGAPGGWLPPSSS